MLGQNRDPGVPELVVLGHAVVQDDGLWLRPGVGEVIDSVKQLRAIVESPGFRRQFGKLDGQKLQRVPRGFPRDHPAAEYLKFRSFLAGAEFPGTFAASPKFYGTLLTVFRQVTPLTRFLNAPLLK